MLLFNPRNLSEKTETGCYQRKDLAFINIEDNEIDLSILKEISDKKLTDSEEEDKESAQTNTVRPKDVQSNVIENPIMEGKIMDLNELKQDHANVYDQAVEVGVKQERERVASHLEQIDVAPDVAIKAIQEGTEFTSLMQSKYLKARGNKVEIKAMEDENPADVIPAVDTPPAGEDAAVVAKVGKLLDEMGYTK